MLRNHNGSNRDAGLRAVLNEVLSLNAQEWPQAPSRTRRPNVLNEVLSLNAQE